MLFALLPGVLKAEGTSEGRVRFSSSQIPVEGSDHGWQGVRADSGGTQYTL